MTGVTPFQGSYPIVDLRQTRDYSPLLKKSYTLTSQYATYLQEKVPQVKMAEKTCPESPRFHGLSCTLRVIRQHAITKAHSIYCPPGCQPLPNSHYVAPQTLLGVYSAPNLLLVLSPQYLDLTASTEALCRDHVSPHHTLKYMRPTEQASGPRISASHDHCGYSTSS